MAGFAQAGTSVTITNYNYDLSENVQVFAKIPKRVISTNGSATELLLSLGLEKRMLATAYLDNPPSPELEDAYGRIPVLSRLYPGKEQVLGLEPDMLVGWQSAFAPRVLGDPSYWNRLGVGTFILRDSSALPKSLGNIHADIRDLGRIFRVEERAEEILRSLDSELSGLKARAALREGDRLRALILECLPGGRLRAWGDNSTPGRMLQAIGAENVFSLTGDQNKEGIVKADPDAVIFIYMDSTLRDTLRLMEDFRTDPILSYTKASRTGRLGLVPLSESYCPGVRLGMGLRRMAGILFGDGPQG
ncbi:MAG: ABC transporter substrate-binding protein [Deltaproteobacteria bacterium]|jgi:iron complex transport system substrate-binding protein|nr:ABC transporter substrate-binding protein [Deltaproteobacteria bacterium]